jgi:hypothetical protein
MAKAKATKRQILSAQIEAAAAAIEAAAADEIERLRIALGGIKVMEPDRFHNGNRNDLIACAAWEIAKQALEQNKPETRISEQASEQPKTPDYWKPQAFEK